MKRRRLSFNLRSLLVVSIVLTVFAVLNLRPSCPYMPDPEDGVVAMTGGAYWVYNTREYGWPLGCVRTNLGPDWDNNNWDNNNWDNLDFTELKTIYTLGELDWWSLAGNAGVLLVVTFLVIRLAK